VAGSLPHYKQGPASYTAGGLILGGQIVYPATGLGGALAALNGIGVLVAATGQQVNALGVAGADANNTMFLDYNATYGPDSGASLPAGWAGDGSSTAQDTVLDVSILGFTIPVYNNVDINVNYDGTAVSFGQLLQTSTTVAGAVMAWSGSNPQAIIGRCTQPGGVTAAAQSARAFIRV
jgi:hypothetical protein